MPFIDDANELDLSGELNNLKRGISKSSRKASIKAKKAIREDS